MKKEFHYNYADAKRSAEAYANENNYYVSDHEALMDERSMSGCNYMDEQADNLCWSGEVSAIIVEDIEGAQKGVFAYWE